MCEAILRFVVPGAPVPCARAQTVRTKRGKTRTFTPDRTAGYEQRVAWRARAAVAIARWKVPTQAEYRVEIRIFREARRGDWDNYAKAICDGSNGIVWADDRQVVEALVVMSFDRENPRVEVTVERLEVA